MATPRLPERNAPLPRRGRRCRRGFTLVELLLVVAIIVILAGIMIPMIASVRKSAASVRCVGNLRAIASALQQYAMESPTGFPDPFVNEKSWEASLRGLLPASDAFVCPSDREVAPSIGSSYDWRDTGKPETTMAGRTLGSCDRMEAVLVFDALPGWHQPGHLNVARMDGTAGPMDQHDCFKDLTKRIR